MSVTHNVATYVPPAPPVAQGLVPATLAEAMQLANMMASSKLVPAALRDSPADCLMVIQQAVRWQMDPFAVAVVAFACGICLSLSADRDVDRVLVQRDWRRGIPATRPDAELVPPIVC